MKSPPIEKSLPRACAIAPALREIEERKLVTREETTGKTRPASLRPGTVRGCCCCCCVTRRDRQREDEGRGGKKGGDTPPTQPCCSTLSTGQPESERGIGVWRTLMAPVKMNKIVLHIMRPNEANAASQYERPTTCAFRSLQ